MKAEFVTSPADAVKSDGMKGVKYDREMNKEKRMHLLMRLYQETFLALLNFIKGQVERPPNFRVPLKDLGNEEIRTLNSCVEELLAGNERSAAERIVSLVEEKLDRLLFNSFTLLYGDREARLRMLGELRHHIDSDSILQENEFHRLRDHYRTLMTGLDESTLGQKYWNYIFREVFRPWTESELNAFLLLSSDIHQILARNNEQKVHPLDAQKLYDFIPKSTDFTVKVTRSYSLLLQQKYFRINDGAVTFSYCDFQDGEIVTAIQLSNITKDKIWEVVSQKSLFRCPLEWKNRS